MKSSWAFTVIRKVVHAMSMTANGPAMAQSGILEGLEMPSEFHTSRLGEGRFSQDSRKANGWDANTPRTTLNVHLIH